LHSIGFLFSEFWLSLRNNRFLHFTYGTQVTISLLVLGIFFVLLIGSAVTWNKLGQQLQIHVYLQDGLSAQQQNALEADLRKIEHVVSVTFRSKEQALELFKKSSSTIDLSDLADNPLPASYVVKVDDPREIPAVAEQCEGQTGILSVKYGAQVVDKYIKVLMIMVAVCAVTISLLVLFTASSINNIIALSIYARRKEIRIMQLVGATWWFIRWPFIFEGVFFGMLGALLALLIILGILYMLGQALVMSQMSLAMPNLGLTTEMVFLALGGVLLALGAIVGFVGSLRTVNNFLGREQELNVEALRVRQMLR
jgi:cell division transport system permease protein